jgi:hypothetical protein
MDREGRMDAVTQLTESRRRSEALARLQTELERIGLLLEHDKLLPSATTLIAGVPITGSWWGHALGHEIYAVLGELGQGPGALCAKLVNAKRTYVHPRLYGAFFGSLEAGWAEAASACSPLARELLEVTTRQGLVRMADVAALASVRAITAAIRELDERCLVRVDSEHTASGKHEKTLESWSSWRARHAPELETLAPAQARAALSSALERLTPSGAKTPKLAL